MTVRSSALLLIAGLLTSATPAQAAVGLRVEDGRLFESTGDEFIMRGVSHPHTWFAGELDSLAEISGLGANTARIVLSSGARWTRNEAPDVAHVIAQCKAVQLICMLEVHDTTGFGEEGAAASLDAAVDYWISIRDVLVGEEDYVLINIGNEPFGNSGFEQWTSATASAIGRMRSAGFEHTLVVDGPNWGQDWSFTMRNTAAQVHQADPSGNTMFSIHMYGVFDTAPEVAAYLEAFRGAGLPILVGEFGHMHSDGDPAEDAIMATAQALGVGYIGWSWSGNGGGVEYLDMVVNFDGNNLTSWGQRIFHGADGIAQTSQKAHIFDPQ